MKPDTLLSSTGLSPYEFGAALAACGDTLLVGSPYRYYGSRQDEGIPPPVACRFGRGAAGTWSYVQSLKAGNPSASEGFGRTVALSTSFATVGSPGADGADGPVEQFAPDPRGQFVPNALLESPALPRPFGDLLSRYGASLAGDDQLVAVGAPLESCGDDGCEDGGAVYLFDRRSRSFTTLRGQRPSESFGTALAIAGDLVVIGAAANFSNERLPGAVYVLRRQADGSWREVARIQGRHPGEEFGAAVALSGTRIAVVAPGRADLTPKVAGRVDLLDVQVTGCTPVATLDFDPGFGSAVALSGERLAIGHPMFQAAGGPVQTGRVGLYRVGASGGVRLERWLVASNAPSHARLGRAVALGPDYVAAGAPGLGEDDARVGFVVVSEFV